MRNTIFYAPDSPILAIIKVEVGFLPDLQKEKEKNYQQKIARLEKSSYMVVILLQS